MLKQQLIGITMSVFFMSQVVAFGPQGHQLVGEIADGLLRGKPVETRISTLLHGITLAQAAQIPDDIKGWDSNPSPHLPWTQNSALCDEMAEFLKANSNGLGSHGHNPDHHVYHYTDISVSSNLKYDKHKTGAGKDDVVQMIPYCIEVLKSTVSQPNPKRITPTVAVILLAHYVGDIHQPLHVGAAYFDNQAKLVDPDIVPSSRADQGGNQIQFHGESLHSFWDGDSVKAAVHQIKMSAGSQGSTLTADEIRNHFVIKKPDGAPLDQNVALQDLAANWANEVLPIAKIAHERLEFQLLSPPVHTTHGTFFWSAKQPPGSSSYTDWAAEVVDKSIHRAGWRLAAILEQTL